MIWDQNDYEERTKQEAELLVALEALKSSTGYLSYDIYSLKEQILHNRAKIGQNQEDVWRDTEEIYTMLLSSTGKVG